MLLHLIEKNKVNIYDIPIVEITNQYMDYIHQMEREDLNIMSEFMVMAATLISIKCRMLLPREVTEEGEEEDPREELVRQLLEYKMYKYMSYELRDRMAEAAKNVYKLPTIPKEVLSYREPVDTEDLLDGLTLEKLNQIFQSVMKDRKTKLTPFGVNSEKSKKKKSAFRKRWRKLKLMLWNIKPSVFVSCYRSRPAKSRS